MNGSGIKTISQDAIKIQVQQGIIDIDIVQVYDGMFSNNLFLQESSQNLYLAQISKKEAFFQLINTQQVYLPHNLMNFKIIFKKVVGYFQEIFNKEVGYFKISPKIHKVCYSQIKVKIFYFMLIYLVKNYIKI